MRHEFDEGRHLIRAATLQDWPLLWPLFSAMGGVDSEIDARPRLEGVLARRDHLVSVVDSSGGSLVGYAWAQDYGFHVRTGRSIVRLHDLYVTPTRRRSGIGTQLFAFVTRWAEDRGATWLQWQASTDALPFYERLGLVGDPCPDPTHPFFEIEITRQS